MTILLPSLSLWFIIYSSLISNTNTHTDTDTLEEDIITWNGKKTKSFFYTSSTYLPVSSTTVASINSVDLSLTITWQSSMSGDMAFSSSSSFDPDPVFVAGSSGIIRTPCRLLSSAVSANLRVCAIFSMTLPPVSSERWGFRAARCLRARLRKAYNFRMDKKKK